MYGVFLAKPERNIIEKALEPWSPPAQSGRWFVAGKENEPNRQKITCRVPPSLWWNLLRENSKEIAAVMVLFCYKRHPFHCLVPTGITGNMCVWNACVSVPVEGEGILLFHTHPNSENPTPSHIDLRASAQVGWQVVSGSFFLSLSPLSIQSNVVFYCDEERLEARMVLVPQRVSARTKERK